MSAEPRIIPVGSEPPPLTPQGRKPRPKPKGSRKTAGGRFRLLNCFVDFALRELPRNEAAVWLVLYRDAKPDGIARTGQADIASRIGASVRTVRRALRQLEGRGLLVTVRRGRLGTGPSAYRVRGLPPEELPDKTVAGCERTIGASTEDRALTHIP